MVEAAGVEPAPCPHGPGPSAAPCYPWPMSQPSADATWPALLRWLPLALAHAVAAWLGLQRDPTPLPTWHEHPVLQAATARFLAGDLDASSAIFLFSGGPHGGFSQPPVEPAFGLFMLNSPGWTEAYLNTLPLTWVLTSLVPRAVGFSPAAVLFGQELLILALGASVVAAAARRSSPWGAAVAGLWVMLLPGVLLGLRTGLAVSGAMVMVALCLSLLLRLLDRGSVATAVAAGATVLVASRMGETAGESLLALAVLCGPVLLVAARLARRQRAAAVALLVSATALLDWRWLVHHLRTYVLPESGSAGGVVLESVGQRALWYAQQLGLGLLGLPTALALGAVLVGALARRWTWTKTVLAAALVPLSVALLLSEKVNDQYLIMLLGPAALALVLGLRRTPLLLLGACLSAGGWWLAERPDLSRHIACSVPARWALIGDPAACDPLPQHEQIRGWRRWNDPRQRFRRNDLAWLLDQSELWQGTTRVVSIDPSVHAHMRGWLNDSDPYRLVAFVTLAVPPGRQLLAVPPDRLARALAPGDLVALSGPLPTPAEPLVLDEVAAMPRLTLYRVR